MKKAVDISKIANDLAENSAFFKKPSPLPVPTEPTRSVPTSTTLLVTDKRPNKETRKQTSPPAEQPNVPRKAAAQLSFTPEPLQGRQMTRKQTFELTKAELDFMDKAKFELRQLGVTKNEMVVTGLELLAKDYEANQKHSYLYRKFVSRKSEESEE